MIKNVEEFLNSFFRGTKKPSLDAMKYFMNKYNNFEKNMNFIHIAGTNGKGSCTEMITNILIKQGYKVGKFLSPHLVKYNERISINNVNIADNELIELIEEIKPKIDEYNQTKSINVTLFELETIIALIYFYRNNVEFVVLETGLGGRYDCTNVITKPLVSIITSIGYDHIQILGNTLEEIAKQKAGIIKENSNTIIFENNSKVDRIFKNTCKERNNTLYIIRKKDINNYDYDSNFQYFSYGKLKNIKVNLKGLVQVNNASICIKAMEILNNLGYKVEEKNIREGLSTVVHKGRMEEICKNPLIIYDGGHNEAAINNFFNSVNMYYKNLKRRYIISILKGKNYEKILEVLLNDENASFVLTSGNDNERYTSSDKLYKAAMKYRKGKQKIETRSLEEAIIEIKNKNDENTVNFIVGSFYIYGDVIKYIENN